VDIERRYFSVEPIEPWLEEIDTKEPTYLERMCLLDEAVERLRELEPKQQIIILAKVLGLRYHEIDAFIGEQMRRPKGGRPKKPLT